MESPKPVICSLDQFYRAVVKGDLKELDASTVYSTSSSGYSGLSFESRSTDSGGEEFGGQDDSFEGEFDHDFTDYLKRKDSANSESTLDNEVQMSEQDLKKVISTEFPDSNQARVLSMFGKSVESLQVDDQSMRHTTACSNKNWMSEAQRNEELKDQRQELIAKLIGLINPENDRVCSGVPRFDDDKLVEITRKIQEYTIDHQ